MQVRDHSHKRKHPRLDKICNPVGNRSACVAWESTIHVDVVEGRKTAVGRTSARTQLRHEDNAAAHLFGLEIAAQPLGRNLPFPFVSMRTAENGHTTNLYVTRRASQAVDDCKRDK